jgi:hypothetical protein
MRLIDVQHIGASIIMGHDSFSMIFWFWDSTRNHGPRFLAFPQAPHLQIAPRARLLLAARNCRT